VAKVIPCSACGLPFTAKRSTAQFCKTRCRVSAHRARRAKGPALAIRRTEDGFVSVSGDHTLVPGSKSAPVTLKQPVTNPGGPKQPLQNRRDESLPDGIEPDEKWPRMYRIRLPDGGLSDMLNLSRAKDAIRRMEDDALLADRL
jgi:hypothetical protein